MYDGINLKKNYDNKRYPGLLSGDISIGHLFPKFQQFPHSPRIYVQTILIAIKGFINKNNNVLHLFKEDPSTLWSPTYIYRTCGYR